MRIIIAAFLLAFSSTIHAQQPTLIKLPFAFSERNGDRTPMENTPVFFNSRLLLVANHRPGAADAKGEDAYLYIDDLQTGEEISRFGKGHSFVSAIVDGDELNVFALEFSNFGKIIESKGITRFVSSDLENWRYETVLLPDDGEYLFNTSVCRDEEGFLMVYETDSPVKFCFKFARSENLTDWKKVPYLAFTGENKEYSACPVIRYIAPYYYVMYLHAPVAGRNGWIQYMARSRDLVDWDLSPYNPVLEADLTEGRNASDVDLIEHDGRTYLYYATGDQETWSTIRVAMFDGTLNDFYEQHFPEGVELKRVSAKN